MNARIRIELEVDCDPSRTDPHVVADDLVDTFHGEWQGESPLGGLRSPAMEIIGAEWIEGD